MTKKYKNAHELLKKLPPIFSNKEFVMFTKIPWQQAHTYLHRWSKKKLILPLGGKSGIYFKSEDDKDVHFAEGIARVFPEAVLIGVSVMNQECLTTQIPHRYNIAIKKRQAYCPIPGTIIGLRNQSWYDLIREKKYIKRLPDALPFLVPEFALADMLKFRDNWVPDPDDIEFDEMDESLFKRACHDIKLDPDVQNNFLDYYTEEMGRSRG